MIHRILQDPPLGPSAGPQRKPRIDNSFPMSLLGCAKPGKTININKNRLFSALAARILFKIQNRTPRKTKEHPRNPSNCPNNRPDLNRVLVCLLIAGPNYRRRRHRFPCEFARSLRKQHPVGRAGTPAISKIAAYINGTWVIDVDGSLSMTGRERRLTVSELASHALGQTISRFVHLEMRSKMPTMQLDRRTFLRGSGVALALPLLARAQTRETNPMRMVCIGNPPGMLPEAFFPIRPGADYETPELLKPLEKHKKDFTVFSHPDHDAAGGHRAVHSFLSGIKDRDASAWPARNISIDQRAAEFAGARTRFPSIVASVGGAEGDMAPKMSWTRNGVNVPPVTKASDLFRALFLEDDPESRKRIAAGYDVNGNRANFLYLRARRGY